MEDKGLSRKTIWRQGSFETLFSAPEQESFKYSSGEEEEKKTQLSFLQTQISFKSSACQIAGRLN